MILINMFFTLSYLYQFDRSCFVEVNSVLDKSLDNQSYTTKIMLNVLLGNNNKLFSSNFVFKFLHKRYKNY